MDWLFDNAAWVRHALNAWPPFWGAGIKIETLSPDFRFCRVTLKSRWWNKNANRTQFGGSMFAMTDPIYPLMLMGYLAALQSVIQLNYVLFFHHTITTSGTRRAASISSSLARGCWWRSST